MRDAGGKLTQGSELFLLHELGHGLLEMGRGFGHFLLQFLIALVVEPGIIQDDVDEHPDRNAQINERNHCERHIHILLIPCRTLRQQHREHGSDHHHDGHENHPSFPLDQRPVAHHPPQDEDARQGNVGDQSELGGVRLEGIDREADVEQHESVDQFRRTLPDHMVHHDDHDRNGEADPKREQQLNEGKPDVVKLKNATQAVAELGDEQESGEHQGASHELV